jgi:RimJ/RimL family protein N-acetyltransferase
MRYIGSGDAFADDVEESRRRLERLIEHQELHGFSLWAVTDRESGAVMGDCGLVLYAHQGPEIELGYRLAKPYWGKGYATEAARAWVAHGFDELGLDRIVAATHPDNAASQRVLEKVGMRYERMADYDGERVRLYAIERESQRATSRNVSSQSRTNRSSE